MRSIRPGSHRTAIVVLLVLMALAFAVEGSQPAHSHEDGRLELLLVGGIGPHGRQENALRQVRSSKKGAPRRRARDAHVAGGAGRRRSADRNDLEAEQRLQLARKGFRGFGVRVEDDRFLERQNSAEGGELGPPCRLERILRQGVSGSGFYIILEGTAAIRVNGADRSTLKAGDFFGEIAIMEHDRRTATVVASTPVTAVVMLARDFETIVKDITEFLAAAGLRPPKRPLQARVTYQDPCHLAHAQKVRSAPRELLKAIGADLVEMAHPDYCCGSAGTYNVTQNELSTKILEQKLDEVADTRAEIIATANTGCMLQLRAGIKARGLKTRVAHVVELLNEAY